MEVRVQEHGAGPGARTEASSAHIHNQEYLITVTCEVYRPEDQDGKVYRGMVYKVFRSISTSALLHVLGQHAGGTWSLVREPELFMNGPFQEFENRIRELFTTYPIETRASFELRYNTFTDQVRRAYMLEHGFTDANVPWSGLARHYLHGEPVNKTIWRERFHVNPNAHNGFSKDAYHTGEGQATKLDKNSLGFSVEEMRAAERSADILSALTRKQSV